MDEQRLVKISKYLSKHLRHAPERIGLQLDSAGWTNVDDLLEKCAQKGMRFSRDELQEVVDKNSKQRFAFDETKTRIRANQGHSIEVDLELQAQTPPDILYHGTGAQTVETILQEGLRAMRRHHVHLSRDIETARNVGARHGRPVVLAADSKQMYNEGTTFYVSENGVWLCDEVPPRFLRVLDS
jgi:putative RNA 2'-phosphotransferase